MSYKNLFLLLSLILTFSSEGPCFISERPKKYTNCRDHPASTGSFCCYLVMKDKQKYCVELKRDEVKDDKIKDTWDLIEAGNYHGWDNITELKDFKQGEIKELRCTGAEFLCNKNAWMLFMIVIVILF